MDLPYFHCRSCLHEDLHVLQVRCRKDGSEIGVVLRVNMPEFEVEKNEAMRHYRLGMFERAFWVAAPMSSSGFGLDEKLKEVMGKEKDVLGYEPDRDLPWSRLLV